jgi:glycine oxidase
MTDFIIVGRGLAASVLMHQFQLQGLSFKTVGVRHLSPCSTVAAGIWNPIVFKRMTKSWLADLLIPKLNEFYSGCEVRTNKKLLHQRDIIKPFSEEQEKTLWLKRAHNELSEFLDSDIKETTHPDLKNCNISGQYGCVKQSGFLDVPLFLESTSALYEEHIVDDVFDYTQLEIQENEVRYKSISAKNMLFCEGFLVANNPWFSWLPLKPAKGEVLTIESNDLNLHTSIFNRNGFIFRTANGGFKVGATYAWNDLENTITPSARTELEMKLTGLITCDYTVSNHQAGIRPSSMDRRPIIGPHPKHKNLFAFNGLGTKGVMLAPYFSENFVHFYLQKSELNPEVNVKRFYRHYEEQGKHKN